MPPATAPARCAVQPWRRIETEKFSAYQLLPSFAEYLLLSARQVRADIYRRTAHGAWEVTTYRQGEDLIVESLGFRVAMDDIYAGIRLLGAVSEGAGS